MHDPCTLIRSFGRVALWHKDPECDGSDDSCGWAWPKFTEEQRDRLRSLGWNEAYSPLFQSHKGKALDDPARFLALYQAAFHLTATALRVKFTSLDVLRWSQDVLGDWDSAWRSMLAFEAGWHHNSPEDSQRTRREHANGLFFACGRVILADKRPWWKHPRWHFWHWRIQILPSRKQEQVKTEVVGEH